MADRTDKAAQHDRGVEPPRFVTTPGYTGPERRSEPRHGDPATTEAPGPRS